MATGNSSSTLRVPAHLEALNALATASGIHVKSEANNKNCGPSLHITWRGTKAQFYSLGLMPMHWRFPMKQGSIRFVPSHNNDLSPNGNIEVSGNHFTMVFPHFLPISSEQNGAVEILDYGVEKVFHGPQDALIAQGFCKPEWFPKTNKRDSKRNANDWGSPKRRWCSRRQPDGRFLVCVESDKWFQQRLEKFELRNSAAAMAAEARSPYWSEGHKIQTEAQFRENGRKIATMAVSLVVSALGLDNENNEMPLKMSQDHYKEIIRLGSQMMLIINHGKIVKTQAFSKQCRDSTKAKMMLIINHGKIVKNQAFSKSCRDSIKAIQTDTVFQ